MWQRRRRRSSSLTTLAALKWVHQIGIYTIYICMYVHTHVCIPRRRRRITMSCRQTAKGRGWSSGGRRAGKSTLRGGGASSKKWKSKNKKSKEKKSKN